MWDVTYKMGKQVLVFRAYCRKELVDFCKGLKFIGKSFTIQTILF